MSVFKRTIKTKQGNSLYWHIDYTINGKRKWESVGKVGQASKADARKLLALRKTEVLQGKFNLPDNRVAPSFSDFSKDYIEYAKENKRSWDRDACSLRCLVPFFGSYTLDETSPILIEKYKLGRKRSVSSRTVNMELSLLRRMFNLGTVWDKCQINPISKVKFYKEELKKVRVLTEEEEHRLLEASSEHLKPILITALNTGMRYGELIDLFWKDVNLEEGYIYVAKSKSGKSRQIPINEGLKSTLKELKLGSSVSSSVSSDGISIRNSMQSRATYVPQPNELKSRWAHAREGSTPSPIPNFRWPM
ncbi:MAG: tyrosine-type recombinase/integrase [Thermodesulfobacteriota bacterium]